MGYGPNNARDRCKLASGHPRRGFWTYNCPISGCLLEETDTGGPCAGQSGVRENSRAGPADSLRTEIPPGKVMFHGPDPSLEAGASITAHNHMLPTTTLQLPKKEGGWGLSNIEGRCRTLLYSRMTRLAEKEGTVTAALMTHLRVQEAIKNPPDVNRIPARCVHLRGYVRDMAYLAPAEPRGDASTLQGETLLSTSGASSTRTSHNTHGSLKKVP
jgi:hypothetical protein